MVSHPMDLKNQSIETEETWKLEEMWLLQTDYNSIAESKNTEMVEMQINNSKL